MTFGNTGDKVHPCTQKVIHNSNHMYIFPDYRRNHSEGGSPLGTCRNSQGQIHIIIISIGQKFKITARVTLFMYRVFQEYYKALVLPTRLIFPDFIDFSGLLILSRCRAGLTCNVSYMASNSTHNTGRALLDTGPAHYPGCSLQGLILTQYCTHFSTFIIHFIHCLHACVQRSNKGTHISGIYAHQWHKQRNSLLLQ